MISLPVTLVVAMFTAKLSQKLGKREFSMIGLIFAGIVWVMREKSIKVEK